MDTLDKLCEDWLNAHLKAVECAQSYIDKKGSFKVKLEKPWTDYEELKDKANEKWYKYYHKYTSTID